MFTSLEESPITQLLQALWRGRGALGSSSVVEDICIGMSVPYTVVYEHNFPKGLFYAGPDGNLQRRVGKEIDSKTVFGVFSDAPSARGDGATHSPQKTSSGAASKTSKANRRLAASINTSNAASVPGVPSRDPTGVSDIVAVYTEKSASGQEGEEDLYSAQYFTDAGLRTFLLGSATTASGSSGVLSGSAEGGGAGAPAASNPVDLIDLHAVPSKNGILQKFVYPLSIHNDIIQVIWTPHVCIAEKLRSCMLLGDTTKTPFQRAATIEAPANFCTRAYVSPDIADKIREQCEHLVEQLYVVERRFVQQMTLYFKIDEDARLWFLWSSSIRFSTLRAAGSSPTTGPAGGMHSGAMSSMALSGFTDGIGVSVGGDHHHGHGHSAGEDGQHHHNPPGGSHQHSAGHHGNVTASQRAPLHMLPKFILPKSCGGDFAARAALFLSRSDTTHRPNKPIKGADDHDIPNMYHVTNQMSFDVLTEDAVLDRELVVLPQRCLSRASRDAVFIPPTRSRLCPKLHWLGGSTISADFRRQPLKSTTSISGSTERTSRKASNEVTAQHHSQRTPAPLSSRSCAKVEPTAMSVMSPLQSRAGSPTPSSRDTNHQPQGHPARQTPASTAQITSPSAASSPRHIPPTQQAAAAGTVVVASSGASGAAPAAVSYSMRDLRSMIEASRQEAALAKELAAEPRDRSVIGLLRQPSPQRTSRVVTEHEVIQRGESDAEHELIRTRDASPGRTRAAALVASYQSDGDFYCEMLLVRRLRNEPVHPKLASIPAFRDQMIATKSSMEVAAQFLQQLRDASVDHFMMFPTIPSTGVTCPPFAFSVPTLWIERDEVKREVLTLCSDYFESIPIERAIQTDRNAGRFGWCDDCSYHHECHRLMQVQSARVTVADAAKSSVSKAVSQHDPAVTVSQQVPDVTSTTDPHPQSVDVSDDVPVVATIAEPPADATAEEAAEAVENGAAVIAEPEQSSSAGIQDGLANEEGREKEEHLKSDSEPPHIQEQEQSTQGGVDEPNEPSQQPHDAPQPPLIGDPAPTPAIDVDAVQTAASTVEPRPVGSSEAPSQALVSDNTPSSSSASSAVIAEVPCFLIPNLSVLTTFLSRMTPFLVVNLRNVHVEVEQQLLKRVR